MSRTDCEGLWATIGREHELPTWEHVAQQLEIYIGLVIAHAEARNLVSDAQRNPVAMWEHVFDSLHALLVLGDQTGSVLLDAGSGNGLPGIPLALAMPGAEFVLVDRSASKHEFLELAIATLGLARTRTVCAELSLQLIQQSRARAVTIRALRQPAYFHTIPGIRESRVRWVVYATEQNVSQWIASAEKVQLKLGKQVNYTVSSRTLARSILLFLPG